MLLSGDDARSRAARPPGDWTFFRENTEDMYALGSQGVDVGEDISIDFRLITEPGSERIARLAFEYAKKQGKQRVTIVTKANVVKTTDGRFLRVCQRIGAEYSEIAVDDWYIDIMTAKLVDEKRRRDFQVLILPNLYGDILTDEAAEFQGGVGTAGSANIGKQYAMFEAIHGSAPRMVGTRQPRPHHRIHVKRRVRRRQRVGGPVHLDRRWENLVIKSQNRLDQPRRARRGLRVPNLRFHGAERTPRFSVLGSRFSVFRFPFLILLFRIREYFRQRRNLRRVPDFRSRAMCLDQLNRRG